jgi:carbamoyl-phosphate synthase small subunit
LWHAGGAARGKDGVAVNLLVDGGRHREALLALEDGTALRGRSVGAEGETFGEIVFNTSMVGYQEIVSDPSYAGQIVTFTYPQLGNYGVNEKDMQADVLHLKGFVVP